MDRQFGTFELFPQEQFQSLSRTAVVRASLLKAGFTLKMTGQVTSHDGELAWVQAFGIVPRAFYYDEDDEDEYEQDDYELEDHEKDFCHYVTLGVIGEPSAAPVMALVSARPYTTPADAIASILIQGAQIWQWDPKNPALMQVLLHLTPWLVASADDPLEAGRVVNRVIGMMKIGMAGASLARLVARSPLAQMRACMQDPVDVISAACKPSMNFDNVPDFSHLPGGANPYV